MKPHGGGEREVIDSGARTEELNNNSDRNKQSGQRIRHSLGPAGAPDRMQPVAAGRTCRTSGCDQSIAKAKALFCSEACYLRSCADAGKPPRVCSQPGCTRVSVPGEQGGARCLPCYASYKSGWSKQLGQEGRPCAKPGCFNHVWGGKPKYGHFCSLECGLASGKGRPCQECGREEVFAGSQSAKLCLSCFNRAQADRSVAKRRRVGVGAAEQ